MSRHHPAKGFWGPGVTVPAGNGVSCGVYLRFGPPKPGEMGQSIVPSTSPGLCQAVWAALVRNRRLPGTERGFAVYFSVAVMSGFSRS